MRFCVWRVKEHKHKTTYFMSESFEQAQAAAFTRENKNKEVKQAIQHIVEQSTSLFKEAALKKLEGMHPSEVVHTLEQASAFVSHGHNIDQFLLGGEFVGSGGASRDRRILTLDVPELLDANPFLKFLVLKHVKDTKENQRETRTHLQIQARVQEKGETSFTVPHIVSSHKLTDGYLGVIMERLSKDDENRALQPIIEDAKRNRITVRISDDISSAIQHAFDQLHRIGFLHGDINDGNVYLRNFKFKDFRLQMQPGKKRPSTLRLLLNADITLIDFERSLETINTTPAQLKQEEEQVINLVDSVTLDVGSSPSEEEVEEANDAFFEKRVA